MQSNTILIYLDIVPVIVFVKFQDTFSSLAFRDWRECIRVSMQMRFVMLIDTEGKKSGEL